MAKHKLKSKNLIYEISGPDFVEILKADEMDCGRNVIIRVMTQEHDEVEVVIGPGTLIEIETNPEGDVAPSKRSSPKAEVNDEPEEVSEEQAALAMEAAKARAAKITGNNSSEPQPRPGQMVVGRGG